MGRIVKSDTRFGMVACSTIQLSVVAVRRLTSDRFLMFALIQDYKSFRESLVNGYIAYGSGTLSAL